MNTFIKKKQRGNIEVVVMSLIAAMVILMVPSCMYVYPKYKVYTAEMSGKAVLAEAESSRQVAVKEAMALKDSAQFKSDAEIIRANGVAAANAIIGDSLKGNAEYLRYLYIDMMGNTRNQLIYVPTEGGLPILEAARLQKAPAVVQ